MTLAALEMNPPATHAASAVRRAVLEGLIVAAVVYAVARCRVAGRAGAATVTGVATDGITEAVENADRNSVEIVAERARENGQSAMAVCDAVMAMALQGTGPGGVEQWEGDRTVVVAAVR